MKKKNYYEQKTRSFAEIESLQLVNFKLIPKITESIKTIQFEHKIIALLQWHKLKQIFLFEPLLQQKSVIPILLQHYYIIIFVNQ